MREVNDNPPAKKKHKIIHWSSKAKDSVNSEGPSQRHGTVFWITVAALLVLGAAVGIWSLGPWRGNIGKEERSGTVDRQQAESARSEAFELLNEARQKLNNDAFLLEKLVEGEKTFQQGERYLAAEDYADAVQEFQSIRQTISDFNALYSAKLEAQSAYKKIQSLTQRYERQRELAPEAYQAALSLYRSGEAFLKQGEFTQAHRQFEEGIRELEKLKGKIAEANEDNLIKGNKALATGDKDGALQAFQTVLERDPGNKEIQRKLKRAETIDQVHPLLTSARNLEEQGNFENAAEKYAEALSIDPLSVRAQQGKSRVEHAIKESQFNNALDAARTAEADGDWTRAVSQYRKALETYPGRPEVEQAFNNAIEMEKKFRLETELSRAYAFESKRQWDQAREVYLKILEFDEDNSDAEDGLLRSGKMIRVLLRYEKLIELAQAYADQGEFQSAIETFNQAMRLKPEYLSLEPKILDLKKELHRQSQPMLLTLKSNRRTWVSIAGYELLGKFKTQEIDILPGVYEVQGRRRNYKNVDFQIRIQQGENPGVIVVSCDEKQE